MLPVWFTTHANGQRRGDHRAAVGADAGRPAAGPWGPEMLRPRFRLPCRPWLRQRMANHHVALNCAEIKADLHGMLLLKPLEAWRGPLTAWHLEAYYFLFFIMLHASISKLFAHPLLFIFDFKVLHTYLCN